jgi:hypothetical protein
VRTICFADCMVDFHTNCWKKFRTASEDRHSEKDYLERSCFTPDCYACIIKILIYDKDNLTKKEVKFQFKKLIVAVFTVISVGM